MEKIRLMGHHVEVLFDFKLDGGMSRQTYQTLKRTRTARFARKLKTGLNQVKDDTLIEIVSGVDDVCMYGCPYIKPCAVNYQKAIKLMASKLPKNEKKEFLEYYKDMTKETDDNDCLRTFHLEIGKSYTWDELERRVRGHVW